MKLFLSYVRHHGKTVAAFVLCAVLLGVSFYFYALPLQAVLYPSLLCIAVLLGFAVKDFLNERRRHLELERIKTLGGQLISELPEPQSITDGDYNELILLLGEEQRLASQRAESDYRDMIDYYTVWAHQIKTPIAAMKLSLQSEDSPEARRLRSELGRIERYVGMVMTYLRLDSDSTDLVIRSVDLDTVVRTAVKQFAGDFIVRRVALDLKETGMTVVTDEKWLGFVLEQVLSNAIKYTGSGTVSVYAEGPGTLCIRDTGIGIAPEDLPRIFENGYTGINGRLERSASGIGLYLCRRICEKLGHGISAESEPGVGTVIRISFM